MSKTLTGAFKQQSATNWNQLSHAVHETLLPKIEHWLGRPVPSDVVDVFAFDCLNNAYRSLITGEIHVERPSTSVQDFKLSESIIVRFQAAINLQTTEQLIDQLRPTTDWLEALLKQMNKATSYHGSPVMMYQATKIDGRWVLAQANQALEDYLGYPVEHFVGAHAKRELIEFVHPEDRQKLAAFYEYTRRVAGEMAFQYRLLNKAGEYLPVTERVDYVNELRCNSVVWHRSYDQVDSHYHQDVFKSLAAFGEKLSFETGRQFLRNLTLQLQGSENIERVVLCSRHDSSEPGWWETWMVIENGALQSNFSFVIPSSLNQQQIYWNEASFSDINNELWPMLFGDSQIVSVLPLQNGEVNLEASLFLCGSKPIQNRDFILNFVQLYGLRILEEIARIKVADAQIEQQNLLVNQKSQLAQMVTMLGEMDRVEGESSSITVCEEYLTNAFNLSSLVWLTWKENQWRWVSNIDPFAGISLSSANEFGEAAIKNLEACRQTQGQVIDKKHMRAFWPLGQFDSTFRVVMLNFAGEIPDKEMLSFSQNAFSVALQGLAQRDKLRRLAMLDSLTQLGNRAQLHIWMKSSLEHAEQASLFLFDLNRFKEINDSFGHQFGDKLLCEIGPRIASCLRGVEHYIARLGGDEFALYLPDSNPENSGRIAKEINLALAQGYIIDGLRFQVEASIGVAHYPVHGNDGHELLRCADIAMYAAKNSGRDYVEFSHQLDDTTPHRIAVLSELDSAIQEGQLWVAYQPLVSAKTGKADSFEALVRWTHPKFGPLSPAEFVPISEMGDGIRQITHFVLRKTMAYLQQWRQVNPHLQVAVNVSPRVLLDQQFPINLKAMLAQFEMPGSALVLELTESTLLVDPTRAIEIISELNSLGVTLEIDDYGTGYSSLAYISRLPISALKIDRSFVAGILKDEANEIIVRSTNQMAHNLGLFTVAEGVEDEATLEKMKALGCDYIQGFYYSKPIPGNDVFNWLSDHL